MSVASAQRRYVSASRLVASATLSHEPRALAKILLGYLVETMPLTSQEITEVLGRINEGERLQVGSPITYGNNSGDSSLELEAFNDNGQRGLVIDIDGLTPVGLKHLEHYTVALRAPNGKISQPQPFQLQPPNPVSLTLFESDCTQDPNPVWRPAILQNDGYSLVLFRDGKPIKPGPVNTHSLSMCEDSREEL